MTYKNLIEYKKEEKTFTNKVKPFLNKGESYYKVYLLTEDGLSRQMLVGYGYRCSRIQFLKDLSKWAEEEVDGFAEFEVLTKKVLDDGETTIVVNKEWF